MVYQRVLRACQTEYYVLSTIYQQLGPLGILSRVTGQFPVHGSLHGRRLLLRFSWLSPAFFYTILCSIFPMVLHAYNSVKLLYILNRTVLKICMYHTLQLVVQMVTLNQGWPDLFDLITDMQKFDVLITTVPVVTKNPTSNRKSLIWLAAPVAQYLWSIFVPKMYYNEALTSPLLLSRGLFYIPHLVQCSQFCVYSNELTRRVTRFQRSWMKYLQIAVPNNQGRHTLRLDHYRSLHVMLMNCAASLNAAFSSKLASICALLFFNVLKMSYLIYTSRYFTFDWIEIMWCFYAIVVIGYHASKLKYSSRLILEDVFDIRICGLNQCLRYQLDLLVHKIDRSTVEVRVPGLVVFSRQFIGSFVSAMVIYFILITQLTR